KIVYVKATCTILVRNFFVFYLLSTERQPPLIFRNGRIIKCCIDRLKTYFTVFCCIFEMSIPTQGAWISLGLCNRLNPVFLISHFKQALPLEHKQAQEPLLALTREHLMELLLEKVQTLQCQSSR